MNCFIVAQCLNMCQCIPTGTKATVHQRLKWMNEEGKHSLCSIAVQCIMILGLVRTRENARLRIAVWVSDELAAEGSLGEISVVMCPSTGIRVTQKIHFIF